MSDVRMLEKLAGGHLGAFMRVAGTACRRCCIGGAVEVFLGKALLGCCERQDLLLAVTVGYGSSLQDLGPGA